jgi:hypothetical protein
MHQFQRVVLLVAATFTAITMPGCGGGGDKADTTPTSMAVNDAPNPTAEPQMVTGRVVDGYIRGATVFWDCNRNNKLDTTESSDITRSGGIYQLPKPASGAASCPLVALVPANAVDEDRPNEVVGRSYIMVAPDGNGGAITPLSTITWAYMQSNPAMTLQQAKELVKSDLNLDFDPASDFKTSPNPTEASNKARYLAQKLPDPQAASNSSTHQEVLQANAQLKKIDGLLESIELGLSPYIYSSELIFKGLTDSLNNSLFTQAYVKQQNLSPEQSALIDEITKSAHARQADSLGFIDLNKFDQQTLQSWVFRAMRTKLEDAYPETRERVAAARAQRTLTLQAISLDVNSQLDSGHNILAYYTSDPFATLTYVEDSALSILTMEADGINIFFGGAPRALFNITKAKRDAKRAAKLINSLKDYGGLAIDSQNCSIGIYSIAKKDPDTKIDPKNLSACYSVATNLYKILKGGSKTLEAIDLLQHTAISMGAIGMDSNGQYLLLAGETVEFIEFIKEITEIAGPETSAVISALDFAAQVLKIYIASFELDTKAIESLDKRANKAFALQDSSVTAAMRGYFVAYLNAVISHHIAFSNKTSSMHVDSSLNLMPGLAEVQANQIIVPGIAELTQQICAKTSTPPTGTSFEENYLPSGGINIPDGAIPVNDLSALRGRAFAFDSCAMQGSEGLYGFYISDNGAAYELSTELDQTGQQYIWKSPLAITESSFFETLVSGKTLIPGEADTWKFKLVRVIHEFRERIVIIGTELYDGAKYLFSMGDWDLSGQEVRQVSPVVAGVLIGEFVVPANTVTSFTVPNISGGCNFSATGFWNNAPVGISFSSEGSGFSGTGMTLGTAPSGALIAKWNGTYRAIGSGNYQPVGPNDSVQFMINDYPSGYADNTGQVIVKWACGAVVN